MVIWAARDNAAVRALTAAMGRGLSTFWRSIARAPHANWTATSACRGRPAAACCGGAARCEDRLALETRLARPAAWRNARLRMVRPCRRLHGSFSQLGRHARSTSADGRCAASAASEPEATAARRGTPARAAPLVVCVAASIAAAARAALERRTALRRRGGGGGGGGGGGEGGAAPSPTGARSFRAALTPFHGHEGVDSDDGRDRRR